MLVEGSYSFNSIEETENSPFAKKIFQFPFIKQVYITANFIAIEKTDSIDWEHILEELKELVDEYVENNQLIIEKKEQPKAYSVYAEMTPNPNVMKFVANILLVEETVEVKNREEAVGIPIFEALYRQFPFIQELFISENYISVTKEKTIEWEEVTMMVREYIFTYLQKGGEILGKYQPKKSNKQGAEAIPFSEVENKINDILEEYVKPSVAGDGGNIDLIKYDSQNKTAYMVLRGACSGCPSSTATLKNGIQGLLNDMLPGVVENVEAING